MQASINLRDREEEAERRRQRQELKAAQSVAEKARALAASERRRTRVTRLFTGGLAVLLVAVATVAYAALQTAKNLDRGKRVVAVLPDTGERYLSTMLFEYTDLVNQPATVAPPPQPVAAGVRP